MRRIKELIEAVAQTYPKDPFFADFAASCRAKRLKRAAYQRYERALRTLDTASWAVLKTKALKHFLDHRLGQRKQGFFNQLNEAFAYAYLRRRGCRRIQMMPEEASTTPDIRYGEGGVEKCCEVKTINISDAEIKRRVSLAVHTNTYVQLGSGFYKKLIDDVVHARAQIAAQGTPGLVYVVILFDDIALDYYAEYRREIVGTCHAEGITDVYLQVGLHGNRHVRLTSPCTRRRSGAIVKRRG